MLAKGFCRKFRRLLDVRYCSWLIVLTLIGRCDRKENGSLIHCDTQYCRNICDYSHNKCYCCLCHMFLLGLHGNLPLYNCVCMGGRTFLSRFRFEFNHSTSSSNRHNTFPDELLLHVRIVKFRLNLPSGLLGFNYHSWSDSNIP